MTDENFKSYLLKRAHETVSNMSVKELENFLGIFKVTLRTPEPIENYSLGELVEIATNVPGIGYEFIGEKGIIYNIFKVSKALGILTTYKGDTKPITFGPEHVRKIKE